MRTDNLPDPMTRRQASVPPADPRTAVDALLQTVRRMRQAQRDFYANRDSDRSRDLLIESKQLERAVDAMLAGLPDPDAVPDLFAQEAEAAP